jgi:hypothetical protein
MREAPIDTMVTPKRYFKPTSLRCCKIYKILSCSIFNDESCIPTTLQDKPAQKRNKNGFAINVPIIAAGILNLKNGANTAISTAPNPKVGITPTNAPIATPYAIW